jgi:putative ABC transport system permease protein
VKALQLAWRYVRYHRMKSLLMMLCIVLTVSLPLVLGILLAQFNRQIVARANSTPAVIGAKGSKLDLVMHSLYFRSPVTSTIASAEAWEVGDRGRVIPIHCRITANGVPVVGTGLEYFEFRGLSLASGDGLGRLGDCVLGSAAARRLGLVSGDSILTDRTNMFEIAGNYPLKMRITGILNPTNSPDDDVIFVDIKTAWVVEGFGHGHDDVTASHDQNLVMERDEDSVTLSPAVLPYTEVTDENIGSFHFHGDFGEFPATALIVIPDDERADALLQGHFDRAESRSQMARPVTEVESLMAMVFRVQKFFQANALLIGMSTLLLLALVVALSIRLRAGEMETMFKIGCSRGTMASLIVAELAIVLCAAAVVIAGITVVALANADALVSRWMASPACLFPFI